MSLIAYPLSGRTPRIRPARTTRDWIDALPDQFAYRCLPLHIANQFGWEVLSPCRVRARWDGGADLAAIAVEAEGADTHLAPASHFGHGILTFHVGALFRTDPGINLFVTGPLNDPKDGVAPLSGIVETDWSPYPFTMNWKFTTAGMDVTWEEDEPIALLFPVQRGQIEAMEPEFRELDSDPELASRYRGWASSRGQFNKDLADPDSTAARERWQKGYFRGINPDGTPGCPGHQTKLRPKPFPAAGE